LAASQPDLDSTNVAWCVRCLHLHRRIILSHNLVTKIQNKLTSNKTGSQTSFTRDTSSKIPNSLSTLPVTQEPSPCLCPNPISTWQLARKTICRGKRLRVELASQSLSVKNWALRRASAVLCDCLPEVSPNPASFDYFPVKTSLAAFVIVQGQYQ
jgi:hypothetical protein